MKGKYFKELHCKHEITLECRYFCLIDYRYYLRYCIVYIAKIIVMVATSKYIHLLVGLIACGFLGHNFSGLIKNLNYFLPNFLVLLFRSTGLLEGKKRGTCVVTGRRVAA